jgi:hypothetical protein
MLYKRQESEEINKSLEEKVLTNHVSNIGLVSRVHKELFK